MKIFILEDNKERCEFFKKKLIGNLVTICDNVEDAKRILINEQFDVAFLDHDLGGLVYVNSNDQNTGYQLAKFIAEKNIQFKQIYIHSCNEYGRKNIRSVLPQAIEVPFTELSRLLRI